MGNVYARPTLLDNTAKVNLVTTFACMVPVIWHPWATRRVDVGTVLAVLDANWKCVPTFVLTVVPALYKEDLQNVATVLNTLAVIDAKWVPISVLYVKYTVAKGREMMKVLPIFSLVEKSWFVGKK